MSKEEIIKLEYKLNELKNEINEKLKEADKEVNAKTRAEIENLKENIILLEKMMQYNLREYYAINLSNEDKELMDIEEKLQSKIDLYSGLLHDDLEQIAPYIIKLFEFEQRESYTVKLGLTSAMAYDISKEKEKFKQYNLPSIPDHPIRKHYYKPVYMFMPERYLTEKKKMYHEGAVPVEGYNFVLLSNMVFKPGKIAFIDKFGENHSEIFSEKNPERNLVKLANSEHEMNIEVNNEYELGTENNDHIVVEFLKQVISYKLKEEVLFISDEVLEYYYNLAVNYYESKTKKSFLRKMLKK